MSVVESGWASAGRGGRTRGGSPTSVTAAACAGARAATPIIKVNFLLRLRIVPEDSR